MVLSSMRKFARVFFSVFFTVVLIGWGLLTFAQSYFQGLAYQEFAGVDASEKIGDEAEEQYGKEQRINILMAGIESTRTDTLMLLSYNQEVNRMDVISIPRDTYVDYGYKDPGRRKINSVYGYPGDQGGIEGSAAAISKLLGVPVHEYVTLDYRAVTRIVDAIGGIEVDIPFRMNYDDPYADPPLHIHFNQGTCTLDGKDAVRYLRWRKNNDGSRSDGDLGRIERQQDFVMKVIKKSLTPKMFTKAVQAGLENTKTSLDFNQAIFYAQKALTMDASDIHMYRIPGEDAGIDGLWYFKHDLMGTKRLMRDIYDNVTPRQETVKN